MLVLAQSQSGIVWKVRLETVQAESAMGVKIMLQHPPVGYRFPQTTTRNSRPRCQCCCEVQIGGRRGLQLADHNTDPLSAPQASIQAPNKPG